ncbi:MAG: hypothetical protein R3E79_34330 [Caldilineaceae bacterium]
MLTMSKRNIAMSHPIIGWEETTPIPNHQFSDLLSTRYGRLHYKDLDLVQLFLERGQLSNIQTPLPTPIDLAYLPTIRHQVTKMQQIFADAIVETEYAASFHYAYASKASTTEEVVRSTLESGACAEISSSLEVEIACLMLARGLLPPDRMVIANGFKIEGSDYAQQLIKLNASHAPLTIVVEDIAELRTLLKAGHQFNVGLRQKSYGQYTDTAGMDAANSRFGLNSNGIAHAGRIINDAPNLRLTMYHAMLGRQLTDHHAFVDGLIPAIHAYAWLRQQHPYLTIFNFGGGVPVAMSLNFDFDYQAFARLLLMTVQRICNDYRVPVPDIMGEFGAYTTAGHGIRVFKVSAVKENGSTWPWYIINGSIMTSFFDVWALNEHFVVLPLNHLDRPFQRVQLGGMTCDSHDVYPPLLSQSPLYLPIIQSNLHGSNQHDDELYIGFFNVGAYQEMLRGVPGSRFCGLPDAGKLIIDCDKQSHSFRLIPGQTTDEILHNLRY